MKQKEAEMPNGYDYSKEYGPHDYSVSRDCKFGCGCFVASSSSHGPLGLDPIGGECPGNPKDGIKTGYDYEVVAERRIRKLGSDLYKAEMELSKLRHIKTTPKAKLLERAETAEADLNRFHDLIGKAKEFMNQFPE
jgi:hypothetical protein